MFNHNTRKQAVANFEATKAQVLKKYDSIKELYKSLNSERADASKSIFSRVELYINSLANSPKEFNASFTKLNEEITILNTREQDFSIDIDQAVQSFIVNICKGSLFGAGIAIAGPSAAMGLVGLLGTASTGAVISSLSGAAATNATLAFIGGGSLASGGAGIAGGKAVLALAGPIGWTIGLGFASYSAYKYNNKNKEVAEQANKATKKLEKELSNLKLVEIEITKIVENIQTFSKKIIQLLNSLKTKAPSNYDDFSSEQKNKLIALINNINAFSELLNQGLENNG